MAEKYKVITISDHPLVSSGVGTQTKYIIEGLLATGKFQFRSIGGAIKHQDYRPQKIKDHGDDWIIFPVNGYGDENLMRQLMDAEKPDAIWFMTDPRFFGWLFNMSDEIRDRNIPLLYYHVWDNYPVPKYNEGFYRSCDFIGCISKLTHDIVSQCGMKDHSQYIPHAVNPDVFKQLSKEEILKYRKESLKNGNDDKFVFFYNSRNARRKMTSDIIKTFKMFLDEVGKDKAFMLMHTDPHDKEGANLIEVAKMLELDGTQLAFSNQRVPPEQMAIFYNIADATINLSNNEGFGLSCLESLSCGTPVVVNKTGGLQDQPVDDEGNVFGCLIKPATKSLTGSQEIPYILDDRVADKDAVEAYKKLFNMSFEERYELGRRAREWTLKAFSIENMVKSWEEALTKYIEEFKTNGYAGRVRFSKV
jgi:glycosyltransferase involved in cell wall biosynthesis